MSYKNVLYGDLKDFTLNSKNELDDGEINNYINAEFLNKSVFNFIRDLNIGYHLLIYTEDSIGASFYITDKRTINDNIKDNLDNSFAQIQTHIDKEDGEFTIKWVGVSDEHRGNKYAQFLIFLSLLYTKTLHGSVNKAMLDDDTDNYANGPDGSIFKSKNIYCKLGFKYEDERGGPEMIGDIDKLIEENTDKFLIKRKNTEETVSFKKRRAGSKKKKKTKKKKSKRKKSKKKKSKKKKKKTKKKSKKDKFIFPNY